MKFLDYFDPYPEQVAYIGGYKVIDDVDSTEKCAQNCRMEKGNICRGFEYCKSLKKCSLHKKHILDLAEGEKSTASKKNPCIHYAGTLHYKYCKCLIIYKVCNVFSCILNFTVSSEKSLQDLY